MPDVSLVSGFEQVVVEEEGEQVARFDNEWVVEMVGGEAEARATAESLGYRFVGPVNAGEYENGSSDARVGQRLCLQVGQAGQAETGGHA